ncbi:MAG: hypothetical protein FWG66_12300 [Spirochaetes bacterium]|nr:hypothetical protein [Spirochaetota bacterium]
MMKLRLISKKALSRLLPLFVFIAIFFAPLAAAASPAEAAQPRQINPATKFGIVPQNGFLFPYIFFTDTVRTLAQNDNNRPAWVHTVEELERFDRIIQDQTSLLLNNYILSYYGHPYSRNMGILGRYSIEELSRQLSVTAAQYEAISEGRGVIRAFHLIFGTVHPDASIGILRHSTLMSYINYALENDMLVFIDHQIGRYDPIESLRRMFPYLHYPNVHLALDPEWRTLRPNIEIGHLTADEINRAQQAMEDYLIENDLPGERMLMFHQFHYRMVRELRDVRADFRRVRLIHNIAGIGSPQMKRNTYNWGAAFTNIPVKGFKLWYDFGFAGHTDTPLMSPQDVFGLSPRPYIIMYQ